MAFLQPVLCLNQYGQMTPHKYYFWKPASGADRVLHRQNPRLWTPEGEPALEADGGPASVRGPQDLAEPQGALQEEHHAQGRGVGV